MRGAAEEPKTGLPSELISWVFTDSLIATGTEVVADLIDSADLPGRNCQAAAKRMVMKMAASLVIFVLLHGEGLEGEKTVDGI